MLAIVEFLERNIGILCFGLLCFVLGIFIQGGFTPDVDRVTAQVRSLDETVTSLSAAESARDEAVQDLTASVRDLSDVVGERQALDKDAVEGLSELADRTAAIETAVAEMGGTIAEVPAAIRAELGPMLRGAIETVSPSPGGAVTPGASSANADGAQTVTLTIGQSAWLVEGRVSAALAYVYPDGGSVRIGLANALHDLSVDETVDVRLEDRQCTVGLAAVAARSATVRIDCGDL